MKKSAIFGLFLFSLVFMSFVVSAEITCTDSDDGLDYFIQGEVNGLEIPDVWDTWNDYCGTFGEELNKLVEYTCEPDNYGKKNLYDCPNGCSDGACLVEEKILCTFIYPEDVQVGDLENEQECYLAGKFGPEDEGTKFCKGIESCEILFKGFKGENITWKSTCGEYQYTIMDGEDETIEFECEFGEVEDITSIARQGFRHARWECYDGTGGGGATTVNEETGEESCKSSEFWQEEAIVFCENRCSEETGKCGVNSFSVGGECFDDEIENGEGNFSSGQGSSSGGGLEEIPLICKNSCAFEDSCLPIGVRTEGKYCNINGELLPQSGSEEQCNNSFECESNVCVSGQCIETGLIQKILDFFRRLFGGSANSQNSQSNN